MHVRLHESLFEPKGDTVVDPSGGRRRRRARVRRGYGDSIEKNGTATNVACLGVRGEAGDTLATSMLTSVRVREAIVRRNHLIDAADRAPARRPTKRLSLVAIDWARARDTGLRVERIGADTLLVSGVATGCVPSRSQVTGRSTSSVSRAPALSLGVDGATFTETVVAGESARDCVTRWCDRFSDRYELEVLAVDDAVQVRFVRPLTPR